MGRGSVEYLGRKTDQLAVANLIDSDIGVVLNMAAIRLFHDNNRLHHLGFGSHFLKWLAFLAALYLLILDRTHWRTNMLTSLLVPYIFLSLPSGLFHFLRGEVGKWIAFVAVVQRLFFNRHFPEWVELPGSLILVLVVAPELFAQKVKESWIGIGVLIAIGCYLLQEIRATGGIRNSLTQTHGFSNTIGLILLLSYRLWAMLIFVV